MEFRLDAEQELLEKTVRSFAHAREAAFRPLALTDVTAPAPSPERRAAIDACWADLASLGFTGLLVAADAGGTGGTLLDATLVAEALAYNLLPVPYAGSAIVAATLLGRCPTKEGAALLGRLAGGEHICVALEADLCWPPEGRAMVAWDWLPDDIAVVSCSSGVRSVQPTEGV